jgi:hypothetical protein
MRNNNRLDIIEIFFKTYPASVNSLTNQNIEDLLFKLFDYFSASEDTSQMEEFENYIKITFSYLTKEKNFYFFIVLLEKVTIQLRLCAEIYFIF